MTKRSLLVLSNALLVYLLLAFGTSFVTGCANIQPPLGGPKDTIAPTLLKAFPEEFTTNFKEKIIRLEFDEYVKLEDAFNNVIVNPLPDKAPIINGKLRTVTIQIKDTLKENTTYSIDFGNAIRDVNEGNIFRKFTYAFSTGSKVDSLTISGKIENAETGAADSTLIISLYENLDDSAVSKEKPKYVTKPNAKGEFTFRYIKAGTYNVFTMKDPGNKRYLNNTIPFGFLDSTVTLETGKKATDVLLRFFEGEKEPEKTSTASKKKKDEKFVKYATNLNGAQDILSVFAINFDEPIAKIDTGKISLLDTLGNPVKNIGWTLDSTAKQLALNIKWQPETDYILILDKNFVVDSANLAAEKIDTIKIKTKPLSEYGEVTVNLKSLDVGRYPRMVWILDKTVVKDVALTGSVFKEKIFKPGAYSIRVYYDTNRNGKWDTGNYWEKLQPELTIAIEDKLNVKAGWENEFDIQL
ncbi:Ig-like domain-containing protein [Polluticaenibacter yanchengensis]|uniref:Ig-like domain-containing protein n=1 Tax=Polluticaenibacter yanchengensis TaxID=3014562 RepID=A0ABT4UFC4_9BACT|nr:Ig-like domain-containing protein [Chitinophagaceae bacterium LY-5]